MDRKLLDLLVSPDTRQPLFLLESAGLEALNRAIGSGGVTRADMAGQPIMNNRETGRTIVVTEADHG